VVISKLGFGRSGIRKRTELVYTAFVQFRDRHLSASSANPSANPSTDEAPLRMLAMTLVVAGDRAATELDARMAAEITEIVRRLVTQEL
jgi:hypothetical protein